LRGCAPLPALHGRWAREPLSAAAKGKPRLAFKRVEPVRAADLPAEVVATCDPTVASSPDALVPLYCFLAPSAQPAGGWRQPGWWVSTRQGLGKKPPAQLPAWMLAFCPQAAAGVQEPSCAPSGGACRSVR